MERFRAVVESVPAGQELPKRQRQVFELVRTEGWSIGEAGKQLRCRKSTVCRNLEIADRIIRQAISPEEYIGGHRGANFLLDEAEIVIQLHLFLTKAITACQKITIPIIFLTQMRELLAIRGFATLKYRPI